MIIKTEPLTHMSYESYERYVDALKTVFGDGIIIDSTIEKKWCHGVYEVDLDKTYWSELK